MLRIDNLSVKYLATGRQVLDHVNLSVDKGETVAIIGPSGCGKTTLLNAISNLLFEKETVRTGTINLETEKIAVVFQEPRLIPWKNVLKNVSFALEAKHVTSEAGAERARKILGLVGLSDYESFYPSQLSLGMMQRVNFARALVCEPELLLMDEPFSALDEVTKADVIAKFKEVLIKLKITTIFVTHNKDEAKKLADRVVTLSTNFVGISKNQERNAKPGVPDSAWDIL